MSIRLKQSWQYIFLILPLILSVLGIYLTSPQVKDVAVKLPSGKTIATVSLYNDTPQDKGTYQLKARLIFPALSQHALTLLPDDCLYSLKLNGKTIRLPSTPFCYGDIPVPINLGKFAKPGVNSLEATVNNSSGPFGLYLRSSLTDPVFAFFAFIGIGGTVLFLGNLMKRVFKFGKSAAAIIIGSFLIRLWYLSYTVFTIRGHDVWPHIEYMTFISRMFTLPNADACYECHQQPLYYFVSSLVLGIARLTGYNDPFTVLQLGSVLLFTALTVVAALLFRHLWKDEFLLNISVALFAFWPAGIIDSVRIGNDVPLYAVYGMALFLIYRYLTTEGKAANRYLLAVLATAGVAVFIKISAIAILPLMIATYLIKHVRQGFSRNLFIYLIVCSLCIVFISFIPYFMQTNKRSFFSRITKSDLTGRSLKTGNKIGNFIRFDQNIFLKVPFTSPYEDSGGRQYVWNYFLKTSLFGEYSFNSPLLKMAAISLSYLALSLFIYTFAGVLLIRRGDLKQMAVFTMNALILFIMFLYYRSHFPSAPNTDFRYIFPVLISFLYFFVYTIKRFKEEGVWPLAFVGCALAITFVILTQYFFLIVPLS